MQKAFGHWKSPREQRVGLLFVIFMNINEIVPLSFPVLIRGCWLHLAQNPHSVGWPPPPFVATLRPRPPTGGPAVLPRAPPHSLLPQGLCLSVPSAWHALAHVCCMAGPLSFRSQLKCQLLREAVPGHAAPAWHSTCLSSLHGNNDTSVCSLVYGLPLVGDRLWEHRNLFCSLPGQSRHVVGTSNNC